MKEEAIYLVPYDPSWPEKFEKEKKLIESTIGSFITGGIHHVGSTAIPDLSAKPIIDIMVGVESLEQTKACIDLLKQIDYHYFPYKPEIMHWFLKPNPQHRTHHLYLMATTDPEYRKRLVFRDYLRTHREVCDDYKRLKTNLAKQFTHDREAYTSAKKEFVENTVAKALA